MRILLIYEFFYPESKYIAFALRGQAFAKYLTKMGINVSVITPEKRGMINSSMNYEGSEVYKIKLYESFREYHSYIASWIYLPISILRLIIEIKKNKPDLIIASAHNPIMEFEAAISAKYLSIPIVLDLQDSWLLLQYEHKGKIKNNIRKFIEKICTYYSDRIFAVTPTLREMLINNYRIRPHKIKVVYNGVDLNEIPVIETAKKTDLIHLGSPRDYYGTCKLIDSFSIVVKKLPNTSLKFIGCEDNEYTQKIRKYITDLGLSKNITLIPFIPYNEVLHELSEAKIGVHTLIDLPIYKCVLGAKVYQYMSMGLPTAYLGPEESEESRFIINNGVGTISYNPQDYTRQLIDLISNQEIRDQMKENALKTIKNYSWKKIVEDSYIEYLQCINK